MDLRLLFAVLWRFRLLVVVGFALASLLAILSAFVVSFDGVRPTFTHRDYEVWQSHEILLVSAQRRNDEGQLQDDPGRAALFAGIYSRLASSDPVERLVVRRSDAFGAIRIGAVPGRDDDGALPMVDVFAEATNPASAEELAKATSAALREYIMDLQAQERVPLAERVRMTVIKRAGDYEGLPDAASATVLVKPRSKLRILLVFFGVIGLVAGLAFVLENLRPRLRPVAAQPVAGENETRSRSA
jgi:capsular polysaccharide biosynthesis protein